MTAIARSSFHTAANLLPGQTAHALRDLYGACRAVDDLADEGTCPDPHAALRNLQDDLRRGTARSDVARTFLGLHATHGMDLQPAQDLVAAVLGDLDHQPFTTMPMLLDYAQGVAGTVGLMMCDIFDVVDPRAREQGAALGRAMQLTNIARDVQTDARLGRRYLPETLCAIPPADLVQPDICTSSPVRDAVRVVLQRAEGLYAEGLRGLPALPPAARLGVSVAAVSYRDIGRRIATDHFQPPDTPRPASRLRRTTLSFQALVLTLSPITQERTHDL